MGRIKKAIQQYMELYGNTTLADGVGGSFSTDDLEEIIIEATTGKDIDVYTAISYAFFAGYMIKENEFTSANNH